MKGKRLKISELKNNQIVFLEFDFSSITQCESDKDYEIKLNKLRKDYQDGLYKVNLRDKTFVDLSNNMDLGFSHNLIGNIYEWIEKPLVKDGIIEISTTMDFSGVACARIPVKGREELAKAHLSFQLGEYISKHFDELPIKYCKSKDIHYKQGAETHEISISLASNLMPVALNFAGKQIIVYVPNDTANELNLSRVIESIVLKGED